MNEGDITMKIFINPGHGDSDPGACGNGLREADVALAIGKRVEGYLRAVGYDVKLFQCGGVDGDLWQICNTANEWGTDLFVSIHCNSFNGSARGTETFHYYNSTRGERLADKIQRQIVNSLPVTNRGVKEAGFVVLRDTVPPSVLVETAFIDNPSDAKLLVDREDDFARAIARGVTDYVSELRPLPDVVDAPTE